MSSKKASNVEDKPWKSTGAEVSQRVTEFQTLILNGYTRSHLLQHAAEKWKVKERTADAYLAKAHALIREVNAASIQESLAIITSNLWHQLRVARKMQDNAECRQILMALAKLKGLDDQKITHVIENRDLSDMDDSDLDAIIAGRNDHK